MSFDNPRSCVMVDPTGVITIDFKVNRRLRTAELAFYQNFIKIGSIDASARQVLAMQAALTAEGWNAAFFKQQTNNDL